MNLIEKAILEWSYKTKKGYPDLNNEEDLKVFESLFGFNLLEAQEAQEALNLVKSTLGIDDSKIKEKSSKTFHILVPNSERYNTIQKLEDLDGFEYDPNLTGSSIGGLIYKGIKFIIKPEEKQGRGSAGVDNEDIVSEHIRQALEQGVENVIFQADNKSIEIENVKQVIDSGYDVSGGKKADIVVVGDETVPISIKKDNAGFWESADSRYNKLIKALIKKIENRVFAPDITFIPFKDPTGREKTGVYTLYDEAQGIKLAGIVVTDLPDSEEQSVIFGSDNAKVIYRTFKPSDFKIQGDTLIIQTSKILTDLDDIEKYNLQPVLKIRHDSTRTNTKGLRALVQPYNKVYRDGIPTGNVVEIPYHDIL